MLDMTTPSITHMRIWLAAQDPNETYNWWSCSNCVFAQYAASLETDIAQTSTLFVNDDYARIGCGSEIKVGLTQEQIKAQYGHLWTFGQALERFDKVVAELSRKPRRKMVWGDLILEMA